MTSEQHAERAANEAADVERTIKAFLANVDKVACFGPNAPLDSSLASLVFELDRALADGSDEILEIAVDIIDEIECSRPSQHGEYDLTDIYKFDLTLIREIKSWTS